jgi:hypothetical protein
MRYKPRGHGIVRHQVPWSLHDPSVQCTPRFISDFECPKVSRMGMNFDFVFLSGYFGRNAQCLNMHIILDIGFVCRYTL